MNELEGLIDSIQDKIDELEILVTDSISHEEDVDGLIEEIDQLWAQLKATVSANKQQQKAAD